MKVTPELKRLLRKLANNAMRGRELNRQIFEEFDKLGVNTTSQEFISAFGYVEGDGCIYPIIVYIEEREGEGS